MSILVAISDLLGAFLCLTRVIFVLLPGIWATIEELKAFAYYLRIRVYEKRPV
jgi:hypothetical protein